MEDPSKEEIDEFIKANDVDDRAAADLRECPATVQRAVLARGDLSTARNPSAALLVRIRDARVGGFGGGVSGTSVGLPSTADIDNFIKRNDIDHGTAAALRTSSPTIKRAVLASGDLTATGNPSAALAARIADSKRVGATSVMLSAGMALPSSADVEDFLKMNDVDKNSADQLRNSPPIVQRVVISRGDLRSARNPSAALLARIRDAKVGVPEGMVPGMPMGPMGMPMGPMGHMGMPFHGGFPPGGFPPMGFPPPGFPGGCPPPPGDGNPGSSGGYPPHGFPGMYPPPGGFFGGYPPGGMYGGFLGGYPPGYAPGPGGPGAPPGNERSGRQRSRRRSRSSSSSYSGSYSYSRSRSRSRSRPAKRDKGRRGRGGRR